MSNSILIIDDSPHLHKLVVAHLKADPIVVHSATDGESGLAAAAELRPGLILLDVDMPALNGFEVCRQLKASPATSAIPIMFVTADGTLLDKVRGLDLGAVDYLTKPFKPEELRARVRAALRAKHQLEKLALVDGLTGLWNRTYLDLHLQAQLSVVRRSGRPLACILGDIDGLSGINEMHGQPFGDEILRAAAQIILSQCRVEDTVCYGGIGRFFVLVAGTGQSMAAHLADRARAEIERQLRRRGEIDAEVTCSFGVTDTEVSADLSLIERADAALYRAKQLGPNSIWVSRPRATELRSVA